ncbi:hypothetical protein N7492_007154 [Penicillium capsulatum]|uniref:Uncharacterized protein n=1 Tax=Penicillium capsulatum TaxID=69766 RepID=A0A9W9LKH7_9EURO|nr:hypothetical protein N7492_007154 [Penicillium capsulatum]KAJ6116991.1 hypothetical protein N7512_006716 [Penicillium capsulatum]
MKFFATALAIIASSALVMTAPSTQANTHQLSRRDTGKCNGTSCKTGLFDNFECKTGSCTQPSAGDVSSFNSLCQGNHPPLIIHTTLDIRIVAVHAATLAGPRQSFLLSLDRLALIVGSATGVRIITQNAASFRDGHNLIMNSHVSESQIFELGI